MDLQEISDRLEIQDLLVEYCYAIDTRNWDALDDLFTSDAIIDYSEVAGVKGTLSELKNILPDGMSVVKASQHNITTSKIKVEGDRAHGRTICTNPLVFRSDGQVGCIGLWYRDEFVRTAKGWRISSRYGENCWSFNLPSGLEVAGKQ